MFTGMQTAYGFFVDSKRCSIFHHLLVRLGSDEPARMTLLMNDLTYIGDGGGGNAHDDIGGKESDSSTMIQGTGFCATNYQMLDACNTCCSTSGGGVVATGVAVTLGLAGKLAPAGLTGWGIVVLVLCVAAGVAVSFIAGYYWTADCQRHCEIRTSMPRRAEVVIQGGSPDPKWMVGGQAQGARRSGLCVRFRRGRTRPGHHRGHLRPWTPPHQHRRSPHLPCPHGIGAGGNASLCSRTVDRLGSAQANLARLVEGQNDAHGPGGGAAGRV